MLAQERPVTVPPEAAEARPLVWTAAGNVFDTEGAVFCFNQSREGVTNAGTSPPLEAAALLARVVRWREKRNAYSVSGFLTWSIANEPTAG